MSSSDILAVFRFYPTLFIVLHKRPISSKLSVKLRILSCVSLHQSHKRAIQMREMAWLVQKRVWHISPHSL